MSIGWYDITSNARIGLRTNVTRDNAPDLKVASCYLAYIYTCEPANTVLV